MRENNISYESPVAYERSALKQPTNDPQHLDLIDFCLAEFDITDENDENERTSSQQQTKQRDLKATNMRKWPPNRIVNYEQLGRFKRTCLRFYNQYMEKLLLFQIPDINKYASHLDLDKIITSESSSMAIAEKKRLIVDVRILKSLEAKEELNWLPGTNSLYPILTIGDGNCLVFDFYSVRYLNLI